MKTLLPILGLLILFGCNNSSKPPMDSHAAEASDSVSHHHETHAHEQGIGVALNDGKRWTANAETTAGINNMKALVNDLPANAARDDYRKLATNLETEFNTILQKCTMTGEAHNQLHNYLLPMKELFEKLNSPDVEVGKSALSTLKGHLNEYQAYFQ
jgi:hypothetical protein